jgi:hypothetical protein
MSQVYIKKNIAKFINEDIYRHKGDLDLVVKATTVNTTGQTNVSQAPTSIKKSPTKLLQINKRESSNKKMMRNSRMFQTTDVEPLGHKFEVLPF